jgi:hypothetical protein
MHFDFTRRAQQLGALLGFPVAPAAVDAARPQQRETAPDRLSSDARTHAPSFWYLHGR